MIGILVVSHGKLAEEVIRTTECIIGALTGIDFFNIEYSFSPDEIEKKFMAKIDALDTGDGVLVFTDFYGGSGTNIAMTLLESRKVEVITGVNVPMIIKASSYREGKELKEVAEFIEEYAKKNIKRVSKLLEVKK